MPSFSSRNELYSWRNWFLHAKSFPDGETQPWALCGHPEAGKLCVCCSYVINCLTNLRCNSDRTSGIYRQPHTKLLEKSKESSFCYARGWKKRHIFCLWPWPNKSRSYTGVFGIGLLLHGSDNWLVFLSFSTFGLEMDFSMMDQYSDKTWRH